MYLIEFNGGLYSQFGPVKCIVSRSLRVKPGQTACYKIILLFNIKKFALHCICFNIDAFYELFDDSEATDSGML